MTFTQFQAECISMFGLYSRTPKVKSATNSISLSEAPMEHEIHFQKRGYKKKKTLQAQTELIQQQKWETENLKQHKPPELTHNSW